jgi:hypothetical protein
MIGVVLDDPDMAQRLSTEGKRTAQSPQYRYDNFRGAWQREMTAFMEFAV